MRTHGIATVVAAGLLIAGCGGPSVSESPATGNGASEDAAVAAPTSENPVQSTEEATDSVVPILQAEFTGEQGYQYAVDMFEPTLSVRTDIANAPPGKVTVIKSSSATFVVSNRTPERNAPLPWLTSFPVWKSDSPVCQYLPGEPIIRDNDNYCSTMSWVALMAPPGQNLENPINWPVLDVDGSAELIGFHDIIEGAMRVDEVGVDAVVAALEQPDAYVLAARLQPEDRDEGACMLSNTTMAGRLHVVAATARIEGCDN